MLPPDAPACCEATAMTWRMNSLADSVFPAPLSPLITHTCIHQTDEMNQNTENMASCPHKKAHQQRDGQHASAIPTLFQFRDVLLLDHNITSYIFPLLLMVILILILIPTGILLGILCSTRVPTTCEAVLRTRA